MTLVYVPEGEFTMGNDDPSADADEHPVHEVYLNAFWIDKTEITNAMYAYCVDAGICDAIAHPRPDMSDHPYFPVQGVPWTQANIYCEWVGRRLPTEAEWEKAARGDDGRLYPWGNQAPSSELANFQKLFGDVSNVGSFPKGVSPYGVLDMAGNVYEWVADWYGADYYVESAAENPRGPVASMQRVLRGGDWQSQPNNLRSTNRFWAFPGRNDWDGFRCALGE